MGDPTNMELKIVEIKSKIRSIWKYIYIISFLTISLFIITLILSSLGGSWFIADRSIAGKDLKYETIQENNLANKSVSISKFKSDLFGPGLEVKNKKLSLKVSNTFSFKDGLLSLKPLSSLNNNNNLINYNENYKTTKMIIGAIRNDTDTEIGNLIVENDIFVGNSLNTHKINTNLFEINSNNPLKVNIIETNKIKANKLIIGENESVLTKNHFKVKGTISGYNIGLDGEPVNTKGEISAKILTFKKIQSKPFLAKKDGDIFTTGDIHANKLFLTSKINTNNVEGKNKIELNGETGNIQAKSITINNHKITSEGDIVTDGNIKTTDGDLSVAKNIYTGGKIVANTIKLGLSSDTKSPKKSGEISANFISVNKDGVDRIKLDAHEAKITLQDSGIDKVILDGKSGSIILNDGKGQNTTLTVNNILEEITVKDLTIEGSAAFLKVQEGSVGNSDYIKLDAKGPKMEIVNKMGFGDINIITLNALHSEIILTNSKNKILINANNPKISLVNENKSSKNMIVFNTKDSKRGNQPSISISSHGKEVFVLNSNKESLNINSKHSNSSQILLSTLNSPSIYIKSKFGYCSFTSGRSSILQISNNKHSSSLSENNFKLKNENKTLIMFNSLKTPFIKMTSFNDAYETDIINGESIKMKINNQTLYEQSGRFIKLINGNQLNRLSANNIHFIDGDEMLLINGKGNIFIKNKKNNLTFMNLNKTSLIYSSNGTSINLSSEKGISIKNKEIENIKINSESIKITDGQKRIDINKSGIFKINISENEFFEINSISKLLKATNGNSEMLIKTDGSIIINKNNENKLNINSDGLVQLKRGNKRILIDGESIKLKENKKSLIEINALNSELSIFTLNGTKKITLNSNGELLLQDNKLDQSILLNVNTPSLSIKHKNIETNLSGNGILQINDFINRNSIQLSVKDNLNNYPSLLITKNNKNVFKIDSLKGSMELISSNYPTKSNRISINSNSANIKITNGKNETIIAPSFVKVDSSKIPIVLDSSTVQLDNGNIDNSICSKKGQLIIGSGRCKNASMLTSIWVGICQDVNFLRCPIEI